MIAALRRLILSAMSCARVPRARHAFHSRPGVALRRRSRPVSGITPAGWLSVLLLIAARPATAQSGPGSVEERRPPDPILVEEALPTEVGEIELRATMDAGRERVVVPRLQTFFGIIERVSGEVEVRLHLEDDEGYGLAEVAAGLKWLARAEHKGAPAVILGVEAGQSREHGDHAYELAPFVALLKQWARATMQAAIGPCFNFSEATTDLAYSGAVMVRLASRLHLIGELAPGDERGVFLSPGFRYQVSPAASIGVSIPVRLDTPREYRGVAQLQVQFGR